MQVPFEHLGAPGTVTVRYEANTDAGRYGFALLGLSFPVERALGFPVIEATVDHPVDGYGAWMGWVQTINKTANRGTVTDFVDVPPALSDTGSPLVCWGINPTLFDAPCTTDHSLAWRATAFLVVSPDSVMSKTLRPLCGLSWGYTVGVDGEVVLLPVEIATPTDWRHARATLAQNCGSWTFLDSM